MKIDYLIVGQGLAGSLLAWQLIQHDKKVIIVDNGKENASLIAAGLINPVTGMRLVKPYNIGLLLPFAIDYYNKLTNAFQQTFYIEKPILRILRNMDELQACQKRLQQSEYDNYLTEIQSSHPLLKTPQGILLQKQTGYLLTRPLLKVLKNYFISINSYLNTVIDYNEIVLKPALHWKNYRPKRIIFCEGHFASKNPWFSWLPFQPVKGEIITATATKKIPQQIINFGHWFIPLDNNQFRLGATFEKKNLNTIPTTEAKVELINSLKQFYPDISIADDCKSEAGIRPTTLDKRPFIGRHPAHPELLIFNGFGAKGSLQIPLYCQYFTDYLIHNKPIPPDIHIHRYNYLNKLKS